MSFASIPDNLASRRTCERLGATFEGIVPLPPTHILHKRGERQNAPTTSPFRANLFNKVIK
jgi:RimJ/RimL family protein N-acetyltransferase